MSFGRRAASFLGSTTAGHIAFVFLLSRAIVYLSFFVSSWLLPENPGIQNIQNTPTATPRIIDAGVRWDAVWYSKIAREGYKAEPGDEAKAAFWPLSPLLAKSVSFVLGVDNVDYAGVLVTNLAFLLGLVVLYHLVLLDFPKGVAFRTILYLSMFPTSFYFSAFYADALLLLGATAALLYWRRGKLKRAGLLGATAALAHPAGALVFFPLAWEQIQKRASRFSEAAVPLSLVIGGALAFPTYLFLDLGEPTAPLKAAAGSWGHSLAWPWTTLGHAARLIQENPWIDTGFLFSALVTFTFLTVTLVRLRSQRPSYSVWVLTLFALYLTIAPQVPLDSMSRYALAMFPVFIAFAEWGRNRVVHATFLSIFACLLFVFAAMFSQWYWVA